MNYIQQDVLKYMCIMDGWIWLTDVTLIHTVTVWGCKQLTPTLCISRNTINYY